MTVDEVTALMKWNVAMYAGCAKSLSDADAATQIALWAAELADVPAYAGQLAMRKAFKVCDYPVKLSDLCRQLHNLQAASEPRAAELWLMICGAAHKAADNTSRYMYTAREPDGRTQGQIARDKNKAIFEGLPKSVQDYFGGLQGLIDFDTETASGKSIRRRDFEKFYTEWQQRQPIDPMKLPCAAAGPALNGIAQKVLLD